jgi:hypothetical protein
VRHSDKFSTLYVIQNDSHFTVCHSDEFNNDVFHFDECHSAEWHYNDYHFPIRHFDQFDYA